MGFKIIGRQGFEMHVRTIAAIGLVVIGPVDRVETHLDGKGVNGRRNAPGFHQLHAGHLEIAELGI